MDYANVLLLHKLSMVHVGVERQDHQTVRSQSRNLFPDVGDVPDRAGAVVCDENAAVFGDGDTDRPPPDQAIFRHETGEEVFVTAISIDRKSTRLNSSHLGI